jgi:hypothetical protein
MLWFEKHNVYIDQCPFSLPIVKHFSKQHVSIKTTALLLLFHVSLDKNATDL